MSKSNTKESGLTYNLDKLYILNTLIDIPDINTTIKNILINFKTSIGLINKDAYYSDESFITMLNNIFMKSFTIIPPPNKDRYTNKDIIDYFDPIIRDYEKNFQKEDNLSVYEWLIEQTNVFNLVISIIFILVIGSILILARQQVSLLKEYFILYFDYIIYAIQIIILFKINNSFSYFNLTSNPFINSINIPLLFIISALVINNIGAYYKYKITYQNYISLINTNYPLFSKFHVISILAPIFITLIYLSFYYYFKSNNLGDRNNNDTDKINPFIFNLVSNYYSQLFQFIIYFNIIYILYLLHFKKTLKFIYYIFITLLFLQLFNITFTPRIITEYQLRQNKFIKTHNDTISYDWPTIIIFIIILLTFVGIYQQKCYIKDILIYSYIPIFLICVLSILIFSIISNTTQSDIDTNKIYFDVDVDVDVECNVSGDTPGIETMVSEESQSNTETSQPNNKWRIKLLLIAIISFIILIINAILIYNEVSITEYNMIYCIPLLYIYCILLYIIIKKILTINYDVPLSKFGLVIQDLFGNHILTLNLDNINNIKNLSLIFIYL